MLIVTMNDIPGYRVEAVLGEVMGMTVRSANIGQNFVASFRAIGGGEVNEYTQLVYDSRQQVMERMWQQAVQRGANAIISIDLEKQEIKGPDGGTVTFEVDAFRKECLLNGWDDIGLTLRHVDKIKAYEEKRLSAKPWLTKARAI